MQKDETAKLKITVENLNDQVKSVEVSLHLVNNLVQRLLQCVYADDPQNAGRQNYLSEGRNYSERG